MRSAASFILWLMPKKQPPGHRSRVGGARSDFKSLDSVARSQPPDQFSVAAVRHRVLMNQVGKAARDSRRAKMIPLGISDRSFGSDLQFLAAAQVDLRIRPTAWTRRLQPSKVPFARKRLTAAEVAAVVCGSLACRRVLSAHAVPAIHGHENHAADRRSKRFDSPSSYQCLLPSPVVYPRSVEKRNVTLRRNSMATVPINS